MTSSDPGKPRFCEGRIQLFGEKSGVWPGLKPQIYSDSQDRLWVPTDRGLLIGNELASETPWFVRAELKDDLSSHFVRCVVEDLQGRLYFGTAGGIDRFDPATGLMRRFGHFDGLRDLEIHTCVRDRRGALWFTTLRGVSRIVPRVEAQPAPPPVYLSGAQSRKREQSTRFIAVALMVSIGGAVAFHRSRVARLLELEHIRTRIASDLHDDIGASLSHIALLSEVVRQITVARNLRRSTRSIGSPRLRAISSTR
jgi:hypothetical protein